jgi:hypothetical protein
MRPTTLTLALVTLLAVGAAAPVHAQQNPQENASLPPPPVLRAREAACEERLQAIYRQRIEGVAKTHPSVEAKAAEWNGLESAMKAQRDCLVETDEAFIKTLAAQEAECQKLAERAAAGSSEAAEGARCAGEARRERGIRQQLKGFRAQQYACEQQTAKLDEMLRAQAAPAATAAPSSVTPEAGRSYRDQAAERRTMEQARERSLVCAQQASVQMGRLKAALGMAPTSPGAASEESFARETAATLDHIRRAGEGASTWPYETFAKAIETLRGRLVTYRHGQQIMIARNPEPARRVFDTADALFAVATAWESEVRAGRDAARFKADIEAAQQRDASPTARAHLPNSRRGLESALTAQATAARARTDALSRLNSSLAGLQTLDAPRTGAR